MLLKNICSRNRRGENGMAEKSTFIKLDRNIIKWRWYKDINTFKVFIHLLIIANIVDNGFEAIIIHRGQAAKSYRTIADETGLTEMQVRTAIKHLKCTGEVTQAVHPKYSVFTLVNYEKYQDVTRNLTGKQQADNKQVTGKQQQSKNIRIKEEKNIPACASEIDTLKNRSF